MDPWAVFLDMDNTLTTRGEVVPANLAAINRARGRGHKIVLNTGRSYGFIPKKVLETVPFDAVIAGCGCYVRAGEKVLLNICIPDDVLEEMVNYFEGSGLSCFYEGVEENFVQNGERPGFLPIHSFRELSGRATQITIFSSAETRLPDEILIPLQRHFKYITHPRYSEGVLLGYSKATGMDLYLDYAGIPLSRSIAMGDSSNDFEMLEHAAVSVAMGDSTQEVLDMCSYISLPHAQGGVASALSALLGV